jgi:hypothetical protein
VHCQGLRDGTSYPALLGMLDAQAAMLESMQTGSAYTARENIARRLQTGGLQQKKDRSFVQWLPDFCWVLQAL